MPDQPFISIPLDIPDVRVLQTAITRADALMLTVERTLTSTRCRRCGATLTEQHGTDRARLLRHLSILGRPVSLRIRPKRFRCPHGDGQPTTTQQLDWYDPNALHTTAYERQLIVPLVNSTSSDVVAKEDVRYDAVLGILDRWIATSVDWDVLEPFTVLGIDEIALTKGHRTYVAVITAQTATGRVLVLAILPDRLKATVATWLEAIPAPLRQQMQTVCTDMWEGYVTAVQETLPAATIVVDRFHVACHDRDGVDTLRKQDVRRLRAVLPADQQDDLKRLMWLIRTHPDDRDAPDQERLDRFLTHSPAMRHALRLRDELTTLVDTARSKADGVRRMRHWRQRVVKSGLTCFDRVLTLLDTWQDLIANYVIQHQTSGFVEGLNTKLKVLKRRGYGVRTVSRLFQRLTLDLDGYRRFNPWHAATH